MAQLAGYVAEHTAYHHGEESLHGTIVNMAQDFVGTNNLPLLLPSGQFGTRLVLLSCLPSHCLSSFFPLPPRHTTRQELAARRYCQHGSVLWFLPFSLLLVSFVQGLRSTLSLSSSSLFSSPFLTLLATDYKAERMQPALGISSRGLPRSLGHSFPIWTTLYLTIWKKMVTEFNPSIL